MPLPADPSLVDGQEWRERKVRTAGYRSSSMDEGGASSANTHSMRIITASLAHDDGGQVVSVHSEGGCRRRGGRRTVTERRGALAAELTQSRSTCKAEGKRVDECR